VSKFVDRVRGRISNQEDQTMARKKPVQDVPAIARLSDYTVHGDSSEAWTGEAEQISAPVDESAEFAADYGKLGEHVTSVLEAAKQAATTIRDEARGTAQEIVERAQREAGTWVDKARAESDELAHEASRLRVEAEEESREMKDRANAYATEKRREADRQASAFIAAAKREASEHTRAAQERGAALARNVELSEQRLRQLVVGLRDLAVRLEEVLQQAPDSSEGAGAEPAATPEESIEESLRHSAATQGASQAQQ
jgi:F0F1-type ATP synthase membrane subunit b/b'